jgi:hypothetical protein
MMTPPTARFAAVAVCLLLSSVATARPTQEEFFNSLKTSSDGRSTQPTSALAALAAVAGGIVLIVWLSRRAQRPVQVRVLNSQRKLLREVRKTVPLSTSDCKQLRQLADEQSIQNPLVLVLCPSLMNRAIRSPQTHADRGLVAQLIRRVTGRRAA